MAQIGVKNVFCIVIICNENQLSKVDFYFLDRNIQNELTRHFHKPTDMFASGYANFEPTLEGQLPGAIIQDLCLGGLKNLYVSFRSGKCTANISDSGNRSQYCFGRHNDPCRLLFLCSTSSPVVLCDTASPEGTDLGQANPQIIHMSSSYTRSPVAVDPASLFADVTKQYHCTVCRCPGLGEEPAMGRGEDGLVRFGQLWEFSIASERLRLEGFCGSQSNVLHSECTYKITVVLSVCNWLRQNGVDDVGGTCEKCNALSLRFHRHGRDNLARILVHSTVAVLSHIVISVTAETAAAYCCIFFNCTYISLHARIILSALI